MVTGGLSHEEKNIIWNWCCLFNCNLFWRFSAFRGRQHLLYSQIDNSKIEQTESAGGVINFEGSMDFSYTLRCYDEDGNEKDITFGTSRELKEYAFIRLTVMPIRGVLEWSEIQYDELPIAVQEQYTLPK